MNTSSGIWPETIALENKLIHNFLGRKSAANEPLFYHEKWDGWLMDVINKIESMNFVFNGVETGVDVNIQYGYCSISDENGKLLFDAKGEDGNKIIATWLAITNFIDWLIANNQYDKQITKVDHNKQKLLDKLKEEYHNYGIEDLLGEFQVEEVNEFETVPDGLKDWFAVSCSIGVIAYFMDVQDACRFRIDYINTILNS